MDNSKPWYLSRTVWAGLVTAIVSLAGLLGVTGLDAGTITDNVLLIITGVAGLATVIGRVKATHRITSGKK